MLFNFSKTYFLLFSKTYYGDSFILCELIYKEYSYMMMIRHNYTSLIKLGQLSI